MPTLAALAQVADVPFVLTQPDRPAGRGRKLRPGPVKQLALGGGTPNFLTPPDMRRFLAGLERVLQFPRGWGASLGVVRHSPGHEGHIHVRFGCGPAEPQCQDL